MKKGKLIYSEKLTEYIKGSKYIPRKLKVNEYLKQFHKYWIDDLGGEIKVLDTFEVDDILYYTIKYKDRLSACISHPVATEFYCFELLHNNNNFENINILDSGDSFSGAEIKFWFCVNNINISSPRYYQFWKYLNPKGDMLLEDSKYYKIIKNNRKYIIK